MNTIKLSDATPSKSYILSGYNKKTKELVTKRIKSIRDVITIINDSFGTIQFNDERAFADLVHSSVKSNYGVPIDTAPNYLWTVFEV